MTGLLTSFDDFNFIETLNYDHKPVTDQPGV